MIAWNKGLKQPNHSSFMKGNSFAMKAKPGIRAIHVRVISKFGKALYHKCVDCGKQAVHWSNEDRNKYSTNLKRYKPRCHKCHWKYDGYANKMRGNKYRLGKFATS